DANFRVCSLTSETGAIVERYEYDAYGEPRVFCGIAASAVSEGAAPLAFSAVGNPYLHQGLRRDDESGLHENRYRTLHSRLGRFMQRDPLGYVDGMNSYEYVRTRVYVGVDPLGLACPGEGPAWSYFNWLRSRHPRLIVDQSTGEVTIRLMVLIVYVPATSPLTPKEEARLEDARQKLQDMIDKAGLAEIQVLMLFRVLAKDGLPPESLVNKNTGGYYEYGDYKITTLEKVQFIEIQRTGPQTPVASSKGRRTHLNMDAVDATVHDERDRSAYLTNILAHEAFYVGQGHWDAYSFIPGYHALHYGSADWRSHDLSPTMTSDLQRDFGIP
ncbi:MAG: RHS repeat domain-containing protein, partial [Phycisphaerae bacterium]